MSEKRHYRSNKNRTPFHIRQLALCTTGLHKKPCSLCAICGAKWKSMPFVIYDPMGCAVCDSCAEAIGIPAYKTKKLYDNSILNLDGFYQIDLLKRFYWRVGIEKRPNIKINLHAKALIESLCDCCFAYGIIQAYIVNLPGTPVYQILSGVYLDKKILEKAYALVEPKIEEMVSTGQQEELHFDYFFLVDEDHYPGLVPIVNDDTEIDLPTWNWRDYPEFM